MTHAMVKLSNNCNHGNKTELMNINVLLATGMLTLSPNKAITGQTYQHIITTSDKHHNYS